MDCSLPSSSVHGILQARILEWVAIPFSRGSSQSQRLNPGLQHGRQIFFLPGKESLTILLEKEATWKTEAPQPTNCQPQDPMEISPEYSLEGLMLKLQYFGPLMQRTDSLEKTLRLGKIEGRRRRGQQRIRRLDGTTDLVDMGLIKLREAWWLQSTGLQRVRPDWATELNLPWILQS